MHNHTTIQGNPSLFSIGYQTLQGWVRISSCRNVGPRHISFVGQFLSQNPSIFRTIPRPDAPVTKAALGQVRVPKKPLLRCWVPKQPSGWSSGAQRAPRCSCASSQEDFRPRSGLSPLLAAWIWGPEVPGCGEWGTRSGLTLPGQEKLDSCGWLQMPPGWGFNDSCPEGLGAGRRR